MSVIRAEMNNSNGKPAAWAVLEVRLSGKLIARGFADEAGKIALIFPTPAPLNNSLASPPEPSGKIPLAKQKWDLALTLKLISLLIENGANINDQDNIGHNPLHLAKYTRKTYIVEYLLKNGAVDNYKIPDNEFCDDVELL